MEACIVNQNMKRPRPVVNHAVQTLSLGYVGVYVSVCVCVRVCTSHFAFCARYLPVNG